MAALHMMRARPAGAAAVVAVLLVLVASVVPISYERTTGHDVSLTFMGGVASAEDVRAIAQGFKGLLGSANVAVEATDAGGAPQFVLRATAAKRAGTDVRRAAGAFARELAAKGHSASVQVAPHRERVRHPAVAYAWDQIIQISVDGKLAAELESEIRNRLAEAGVPDAEVSVTDHPEGGRDIRLKVERERVGDPSTVPNEPPMPQLILTKDGAPLAGAEGFTVKVQRRKVDGSTSLVVEVTENGKSARAEVPSSDSMSDTDLRDAITTQLRQAGIEASVTVEGGEIQVEQAK